MGDIQFDDGTQEFGTPPSRQNSGSDLTGKIVAWGLASNREQAQMIMIGVAVVALGAAAYLMFFSGGGSDVPTAPVY